MEEILKKYVTIAFIFMSVFYSCETSKKENTTIEKDLLYVKNNLDSDIILKDWICFDCLYYDTLHYELYLKKVVSKTVSKSMLISNVNGLYSYEKVEVRTLNDGFRYISIIDGDTLYDFKSKHKNLFPIHHLKKGYDLDIYHGLEYLKVKMDLSIGSNIDIQHRTDSKGANYFEVR